MVYIARVQIRTGKNDFFKPGEQAVGLNENDIAKLVERGDLLEIDVVNLPIEDTGGLLDKMTKEELLKLAVEKALPVDYKMKKEEIIAAIKTVGKDEI